MQQQFKRMRRFNTQMPSEIGRLAAAEVRTSEPTEKRLPDSPDLPSVGRSGSSRDPLNCTNKNVAISKCILTKACAQNNISSSKNNVRSMWQAPWKAKEQHFCCTMHDEQHIHERCSLLGSSVLGSTFEQELYSHICVNLSYQFRSRLFR
jgi:hypothetical protein